MADDPIAKLNHPDAKVAQALLERCCGSQRWVDGMLEVRPFRSREDLFEAAARIFGGLEPADWLEAFSHHPRIGAARTQSLSTWEKGEQAGAAGSGASVLEALARGNEEYEARFGHVYLVCATGKSAEEMLNLLQRRMNHEPAEELRIAAGEQEKITRLRLQKLLEEP